MKRKEVLEIIAEARDEDKTPDLLDADLWRANLQDTDLRDADLQDANLWRANLWRANLQDTDLRDANLGNANLQYANLRNANLQYANLRNADLRNADLQGANLQGANLRDADLRGANLWYTDLRDADLSGTVGLLNSAKWIRSHLETIDQGVVAYKTFGEHYPSPDSWQVEPGSILEETANPCRTIQCACGINVGTLDWCKKEIVGKRDIWKVLIRWTDLAGVVVPYGTNGKFRVERCELIGVYGKGARNA